MRVEKMTFILGANVHFILIMDPCSIQVGPHLYAQWCMHVCIRLLRLTNPMCLVLTFMWFAATSPAAMSRFPLADF